MNSRNWQLYGRMFVTMSGMALLYIAFLAALSIYVPSMSVLAVIAFVMLGLQYLFSDKIALKSAGASRVSEQEYPELHRRVTRLSQQANIPKPDVAVSSAKMSNAFATGRNKSNAVVCVTEQLVADLNDDELDAVLAHELAHIKNRDVAVMTIASFFSTIAFLIARFGIYGDTSNNHLIVAVIASFAVWIVSSLLLKALSRYREYVADRSAATITGDPLALASALKTISGSNDARPTEDLREHSSMNAFYISHIDGKWFDMFSTHPPTEKRVEALEEMASEQYNE